MTDDRQTNWLWHPKNAVHGQGRVIWATDRAGWVIPGGYVTQDHNEAEAAAKAINALIQAHKRRA